MSLLQTNSYWAKVALFGTNSTDNFNTQPLLSGSPSAHAAMTKALVITTFVSHILVIPAPVLWSSLI